MFKMEDGKIAIQERKNGVRGHSSSGRHGGAEHAESSSIRHHKVTEAFRIAAAQPGEEIRTPVSSGSHASLMQWSARFI
jgi:hypothetical protein